MTYLNRKQGGSIGATILQDSLCRDDSDDMLMCLCDLHKVEHLTANGNIDIVWLVRIGM